MAHYTDDVRILAICDSINDVEKIIHSLPSENQITVLIHVLQNFADVVNGIAAQQQTFNSLNTSLMKKYFESVANAVALRNGTDEKVKLVCEKIVNDGYAEIEHLDGHLKTQLEKLYTVCSFKTRADNCSTNNKCGCKCRIFANEDAYLEHFKTYKDEKNDAKKRKHDNVEVGADDADIL